MLNALSSAMDLIAALHLEDLYEAGFPRNVYGLGNYKTRGSFHSRQPDSAELGLRLAFIRGLAERARGLEIEQDMAKYASCSYKQPD